ncbi:hypothetical protein IKF76_01290 [Candidatus Saccharibacteria bacterium]|nr:hypothetical protein [Candidatus Saccharibacteria bacterium]
MEKVRKVTGKTKTRVRKIKSKLLASYYGNPIKDMRLICITGTTGKVEVAHYVHEIIRASGQHVACLAADEDIKAGTLHKFFSDAWKAGANYVVVTAPAKSLKKDVFYGLPVYIAALTNYIPSGLDDASAKEFEADESTLFDMNPAIVVLNHDDAHYGTFQKFAGTEATLTYGKASGSTVQIESSKLYKKGAEARLNFSGNRLNVATFLTGEPVISYMACAATIASALSLSSDAIMDGIAEYDPSAEPESATSEQNPESSETSAPKASPEPAE